MYYKNIKPTARVKTLDTMAREIDNFAQHISNNYGVSFNIQIRECRRYTKILLLDSQPRDGDNWRAEFQFRTCGGGRGIFLKFIRLPTRLQRLGLGSLCIRWLECMAQKYGFSYIILSSYHSSEGFWVKKGFQFSTDQGFINELISH